MKIKLDDNHSLISESDCSWIVCHVKTDGKGYERRVSGYYNNIEDTLKSYFQKQINSSESTSIKALRKEIKDGLKDIHKWCQELKER